DIELVQPHLVQAVEVRPRLALRSAVYRDDDRHGIVPGRAVHPGGDLPGFAADLVESRVVHEFRGDELFGIEAADFAVGPADESTMLEGPAAEVQDKAVAGRSRRIERHREMTVVGAERKPERDTCRYTGNSAVLPRPCVHEVQPGPAAFVHDESQAATVVAH